MRGMKHPRWFTFGATQQSNYLAGRHTRETRDHGLPVENNLPSIMRDMFHFRYLARRYTSMDSHHRNQTFPPNFETSSFGGGCVSSLFRPPTRSIMKGARDDIFGRHLQLLGIPNLRQEKKRLFPQHGHWILDCTSSGDGRQCVTEIISHFVQT